MLKLSTYWRPGSQRKLQLIYDKEAFKLMRKVHNLLCGISGGFNSFLDKFLRARDLFSANEIRKTLLSMCWAPGHEPSPPPLLPLSELGALIRGVGGQEPAPPGATGELLVCEACVPVIESLWGKICSVGGRAGRPWIRFLLLSNQLWPKL